ncbi:MAG: M20/M25/M40 family metallo-hydrolase [Candidatus Obscuribacterales bacterium]|nr:M20/M25/M40 family metallo-hydrolase [Candidatus Obscuribacterales bacterium]
MRSFAIFAITLIAVAGLTLVFFINYMIALPGKSYDGKFLPLSKEEEEIAADLQKHVTYLATDIGERNIPTTDSLKKTVIYINKQLESYGYKTKVQEFLADGKLMVNLEAELVGDRLPKEIVVVGAHYDSVPNCPGANDNGTGVASDLEIARLLSKQKVDRTIKFVFFPNEENPYWGNEGMGSKKYAERAADANDNIIAMLSLETMGYYSDEPGSQRYPNPFNLLYTDKGNFIGIVGDLNSRPLVHKCASVFRETTSFPCEGGAIYDKVPGVGWSDHKPFWDQGYRAVMVTDTAPFRYPDYHKPTDTADKINYPALARVTLGLSKVVQEISRSGVE